MSKDKIKIPVKGGLKKVRQKLKKMKTNYKESPPNYTPTKRNDSSTKIDNSHESNTKASISANSSKVVTLSMPLESECSNEFWKRYKEDEFNGEEDAWLSCYDWLKAKLEAK